MSIKISVTHAQESDKDIFKPGSLVKHHKNNWIVLVTNDNDAESFCGVVVSSNNPYEDFGHWGNNWSKYSFTRFTGTIIMEQGK